jgi:hypothetical protein
MSTLYRHARLKAEWAKKHIADVNAAVHALENTSTATVEHHPNGGQTLKHEIPNLGESLDKLSLMVGDALHNARAAMDFAWYSTIERCLPDKLSNSTKFPIRKERENVEGALHGIEVDTRCPALFDLVMFKIKPYDGEHDCIAWTLHDLDISDKHLLLLSLSPMGNIRGITIRDANGKLERGSSWEAKGFEGRYIVPFECGLNIEDKGKLSFSVTLQEAGLFNYLPIESLLKRFGDFALAVVQLLENI